MPNNSKLYLIIVIIFTAKLVHTTSKDEGTPCIISGPHSLLGVCTNITKCPYAVSNLRAGVEPTSCQSESDDDETTVCCPTSPRISEQKCEDYIKIRRRFRHLPIHPKRKQRGRTERRKQLLSVTESPSKMLCPILPLRRISGGRNASMDEFPHQTALGYTVEGSKVDWRCGGVLISEKYVLTAGHCINTKFGSPTKVLLGDRVIRSPENWARRIVGVKRIIEHPNYKPPILYNDVAILELSEPVELSLSIMPACLPQPQYRFDHKDHFTISGFGQTAADDEGTSDVLQTTDIRKWPKQECSQFFLDGTSTKNGIPDGIISSQFCAGDKYGRKDTCHGDSGGPLVVTKDYECIFYVLGITSFGSNYCGYQEPGVYTNVQAYLDWIEAAVWPGSQSQTIIMKTTTESTSSPTASTTAKKQHHRVTRRPFFILNTSPTTPPATTSKKPEGLSATPPVTAASGTSEKVPFSSADSSSTKLSTPASSSAPSEKIQSSTFTNPNTQITTAVPTATFTNLPSTPFTNLPLTTSTNLPPTASTNLPSTTSTNLLSTTSADLPSTAFTIFPSTTFTNLPSTTSNTGASEIWKGIVLPSTSVKYTPWINSVLHYQIPQSVPPSSTAQLSHIKSIISLANQI